MIILLIAGLIKNISLHKTSFTQEQKDTAEKNINVELDLPTHVTKFEMQKATTGADTSKFAKKVDFSGLKSKVDKLDVDKLNTVSTDLSKLSNVIEKCY